MALVLTGVILFIVSMSMPFLSIGAVGQVHTTTLLTGVYLLLEQQHFLLSAIVFVTIFLFPLFELLLFCFVLGSASIGRRTRLFRVALRLLEQIRPWNMLEIFMLGVIVTSVKVGDLADLVPGTGLYSFAVLVVVLVAVQARMNHKRLWRWYKAENYFKDSNSDALVSCGVCHALVGESIWRRDPHCPRCHGKIERRIPRSLEKTTALLVAAVILYIPANVLPIMHVSRLGTSEAKTIFGGAVELAQSGAWFIALVVFVASILVPIAKMIVMTYLVWSTKHSVPHSHKLRAMIFHVTEFIGRWSMVDVYVVTLTVAMVQFGILMNVQSGGAIVAFAAVVILTMLAAETFDPRLLWTGKDDQPRA